MPGRGLRIKPMRRESSTVVVLVGEIGEIGDGLLAGLGRSPGISVARAPAAGTGQPDAGEPPAARRRPGWEAGALALREAVRRRSMYVIVPEDPLAGVAAGWRAMWEVPTGPAEQPGSRSRLRTRWLPGWTSGSNCPTTTWLWPRPSPARPARTCTSVRCAP